LTLMASRSQPTSNWMRALTDTIRPVYVRGEDAALLLAFILIKVPCASVAVKPQIGSFSSSFLSVSDNVFAKSSPFFHIV
jgi:hypothetical protein